MTGERATAEDTYGMPAVASPEETSTRTNAVATVVSTPPRKRSSPRSRARSTPRRIAIPIAVPDAVPTTTSTIAATASAAVRQPPEGTTVDSHGVTSGNIHRAAAAPAIIPMTLPRLAKNPRARPDARARSSATTAMMSTISTGNLRAHRNAYGSAIPARMLPVERDRGFRRRRGFALQVLMTLRSSARLWSS